MNVTLEKRVLGEYGLPAANFPADRSVYVCMYVVYVTQYNPTYLST